MGARFSCVVYVNEHVISLGEHISCHPRESGDPVFHGRFTRLLDSRLRGNDKKGSVPAFLTELIPL